MDPPGTVSVSGMRVLVLDDEQLFGRILAKDLESCLQVRTWSVTTTGEAFELMRREPMDLILLDLHLNKEDIDGFEFLNLARIYGYNMLICIVTGDLAIESLEKACRYGADDFMTKIQTVDIFRQEVERLLLQVQARGDREQVRPSIDKLCYLRSLGLEDQQIQLLETYSKLGFPSEKDLSLHLQVDPSALSRRMKRIMTKLHVENLPQLARLIEILKIFCHARPDRQ